MVSITSRSSARGTFPPTAATAAAAAAVGPNPAAAAAAARVGLEVAITSCCCCCCCCCLRGHSSTAPVLPTSSESEEGRGQLAAEWKRSASSMGAPAAAPAAVASPMGAAGAVRTASDWLSLPHIHRSIGTPTAAAAPAAAVGASGDPKVGEVCRGASDWLSLSLLQLPFSLADLQASLLPASLGSRLANRSSTGKPSLLLLPLEGSGKVPCSCMNIVVLLLPAAAAVVVWRQADVSVSWTVSAVLVQVGAAGEAVWDPGDSCTMERLLVAGFERGAAGLEEPALAAAALGGAGRARALPAAATAAAALRDEAEVPEEACDAAAAAVAAAAGLEEGVLLELLLLVPGAAFAVDLCCCLAAYPAPCCTEDIKLRLIAAAAFCSIRPGDIPPSDMPSDPSLLLEELNTALIAQDRVKVAPLPAYPPDLPDRPALAASGCLSAAQST